MTKKKAETTKPDAKASGDAAKKINKKFAPINSTDRQVKSGLVQKAKLIKKHRLSAKRLVLSIGFILLITAGSALAVTMLTERKNGSASNQIKSVLSGEELKDYTSPENKFTILMPGIPQIAKTSAKSDGKDVPITTYERSIENGARNYTFAVFDYTGFTLDEQKVLENSLNSALQNTPGAKITATKNGKYGDLNAIEAVYELTDKEKVYESHIRYVVKGTNVYAMIIIGSNQAKFDEFANSLRLQ